MAGLECHTQRMTEKHPKRPRDPNQLAKSIVDLVTADVQPKESAKVSRSRKAGLAGGPARAKSLSEVRRTQIAKAAADARWKKKDRTDA